MALELQNEAEKSEPAVLSYKERQRIAGEKYRSSHREILNLRAKERYHRDMKDPVKSVLIKEKSRLRTKEWAKKNPEWARRMQRDWQKSEKGRKSKREYSSNLRKVDAEFTMKCRLRSRLCFALKKVGAKKASKSLDLLGCSMQDFREHIESKFREGMTWENRNLWDIDHIIPCSKFDMMNPEDQRKCFHFSNLQPLWLWDNRRKGDRIPNQ